MKSIIVAGDPTFSRYLFILAVPRSNRWS